MNFMDDSKFSFAIHSFRLDTDSSYPQIYPNEKKQVQNLLFLPNKKTQNDLTSKKFMKLNAFAEDQTDSDESVQQSYEQNNVGKIKKNTTPDQKLSFSSKQSSHQYSPKTINLLQNCKSSILDLQQQLDQKNLIIKNLEKQKESLSVKLTEAEKQIQRTHLILSIYLKDSHSKVTPQSIPKVINESQSFVQKQNTLTIDESLKNQIQELKRTSEAYTRQNQKLKHQNSWLQTEVIQLNTEKLILNQKMQTMGKGVGKALSTIKKNNESSRKITEFMLVKQQKSPKRNRQLGKISIHKSNTKVPEQSFETPTKIPLQNTQGSINPNSTKSFYETSQQKLAEISIKAKRIDQLQKLSQILEKMQTLAQKNSESQNSCY